MKPLINADHSLRSIVQGATQPWVRSPLAGVYRRPLYRVGGEQARATSLVRYAPGSAFSAHTHCGGEEFLVLEGVFEDEHGRYPAGTYVRNPPGSRHAPGASAGCMIFVRLRQFHRQDRQPLVVLLDARDDQLLFESEYERVCVQRYPADSLHVHANPRGLELLVLEGELQGEDFTLQPLGWMRLPPGEPLEARAGAQGARVWLKDASPDLGL
ncbi:cupin [Pseudomonas sp. Cab53]|uniref:cupin domain-containing protein n=1 Tax=unclassified Pseudomonas TaxID=196821 RepID=UPI00069A948B|nr:MULTISPECIES: cupin domain-containing protein [unclassified Pseudomonas]BBP64731.1 cupin [Pseudomonas sp. Cab53]